MAVTIIYVGLICNTESVPQYVYYTDGVTIIRKGVRNSMFVVDIALTLTGFAGTEGLDWMNIKEVG